MDEDKVALLDDDEDEESWGLNSIDTRRGSAPGGDAPGHMAHAIPDRRAGVITELREQHRQRQDLHRAEKSLTLQIKAKCRRLCGGDKVEAQGLYNAMLGKKDAEHPMAGTAFAASLPLLSAREILSADRKLVEKRMELLAKQLPVAPWVIAINGFGLGSLAAIVGETGDLNNYANPAKVWKRMGLAVMPDGSRQRRVLGDAALDHGFSPRRRAVMWNVTNALIRVQSGESPGDYRVLYDQRKEYELSRTTPDDTPIRKIVAHARAQRYVGKRLLRDLWTAWPKE